LQVDPEVSILETKNSTMSARNNLSTFRCIPFSENTATPRAVTSGIPRQLG
jgi:hypothetical protein